jgi:cytochrome c biogenesis protein CcmG/thiol:disulfide interchange protein DsbE
LKKTILLLAYIFTITLFVFTHATRSFAQQPATGPTLDQLKAKNFTVKTLDGESVDLNTLLGEGKPVLIDFWATWCGPCRMVIPHLGELHRKYGKDGLVVIGLNLEDPRAERQAVRNFVKRYRMDYQNVFAQHAVYQFFSGMAVARIPYTLLFGPDGKLSWRLVGYSPTMSGSLNSAVAKAMAGAPGKPAEQSAPEKPVENVTPGKPAEQIAPEKPAENVTPGKPVEPAENVTPEKPAENVTPEKPAEQLKPEKKTCNCPCCSSPASEKKTEPGAPEKPADQ